MLTFLLHHVFTFNISSVIEKSLVQKLHPNFKVNINEKKHFVSNLGIAKKMPMQKS